MVMSPGIQDMQNAMMGTSGAAGSAQDLFERSFSDMAYEALQQKAPDLVESVVTFRILLAELDKGHAIGSFLVSRNKHISYVPVVLSDNKIKPLEIIYSKDLSKFLPLTDKWLGEISKVEDQNMGQAAELPTNVHSDVSLRHLLTPPYVGRHGYASDESGEGVLEAFLHTDPNISQKVAKFLEDALSYDIETSQGIMENLLRGNHKVAEFYLNKFDGPAGVAKYFCRGQRKVAAEVVVDEPPYVLVPVSSKLSEFRRVFDEAAPNAYKQALKQGYAIKEALDRETRAVVITHHGKADLKETVSEQSFADGQKKTLHPVQHTLSLEWPMDNGFYRVYKTDGKSHDIFVLTERDNFSPLRGQQIDGAKHTFIYADGSYSQCYDAAGTPLTKEIVERSDVWDYLKNSLKGGTIKRGKGIFAKLTREDKFDFFGPVEVTKVFSGQDQTRANTLDGYEVIVQKDRDRGGKIHWKDSKQCCLDKNYVFIPLSRKRDDTYYKMPNAIHQAFSDGILKHASLAFDMTYDRASGSFYVNRREHSKVAAADFLLRECKMAAAQVEDFLAEVADKNAVRACVFSAEGQVKAASIFGEDAPGMDPAMMGGGMPPGMDPSMMQGGGMPMDPSMMGGGMPPGMDPSMMQGGGMPPGMDPSMQGMDPSMMGGDPSMGGGMPMDPSMQQQGPGAGMATGDSLEQPEINPQFRDNPELLQDPEIMQMAHLDIIIRSPTLKDIVAQYEDVLLEALDHWGRILFGVYVKGPGLREEIGNMQYMALENGVRNLFRNTGETILDLHQNTAILSRSLASPISDMQMARTTRSSM